LRKGPDPNSHQRKSRIRIRVQKRILSSATLVIKDHLPEFYARYGHGLFLMAKLIKCVTENFSTEEELTEVTDYFAHHAYIGKD
jgi:hypothetical protein